MSQIDDLKRFYDLLYRLESNIGPKRRLASCSGRDAWPERGVYFFFESGEERCDSGVGPRVVRVGTHALTANSRTSLWNRLSQHRGVSKTGLGNHRGSIFRLLVGTALAARAGRTAPVSWGTGSSLGKAAELSGVPRAVIRAQESLLEAELTDYIGRLFLLWLPLLDFPGAGSDRLVVERNSIALLSNFNKESPLDPPSEKWLGRNCNRDLVRLSGLWNVNHVEQVYEPNFLNVLSEHVRQANSIADTIS